MKNKLFNILTISGLILICAYNMYGDENLNIITPATIGLEGRLNEFQEDTKEFLRACKLLEEYGNEKHYLVCEEDEGGENYCYIPRKGWKNSFYEKARSFAQKAPLNAYWIYKVLGSMNNDTLKSEGFVMDSALTDTSDALKNAYKAIESDTRYYNDVDSKIWWGKSAAESDFDTQVEIIRQYKLDYGDAIDSICERTTQCFGEKVDL